MLLLAVATVLLGTLAILVVTRRPNCVEYLYPDFVIPAYRWPLYDNGETLYCVAVVIYREHRFFVGYDRPR